MAKTGFLQYDDDNAFLPITRAELVKDKDGKCAFQSNTFLATSQTNGILSHDDKDKLDKMVGIHFLDFDESAPESYFNISFGSLYDAGLRDDDAFFITLPYDDGTTYGAQIAIDDCSNPTILVRGKSDDPDGAWGDWHRVLLENDRKSLKINRYGTLVIEYDGSVAKTVDIAPIALSGSIRITNANIRDLTQFPDTYNLAVGWWAGDTPEDTCNFNTRYGTTLDLSHNTWYQRLAFNTTNTNGKPRIEYLHGINRNELTKVGDLAYLSEIPTYCANLPLSNTPNTNTEAEFKSVTAQTYNVKNDDDSSFTISYFTGEDSDYLEIGKYDDQILLVNDSHIIPGNTAMDLGDSDHKWNSVYAKSFVTEPNEGEGFKPLCVTSDGTISTYESNIGENYKPVYVSGGEIKAFTGPLGQTIQGLYINSSGKFATMTYTLDAHVSKTSATSLGRLVLFDSATTKMYPYNNKLGSNTKGIYINNTGIPAEMDYSLKATVQSGTKSRLAYYSDNTTIDDLDTPIGKGNVPIWIDGGVPKAVDLDAKTESSALYIVGWKKKESDDDTTGGFYTGTQGTSGVRLIGGNKVYAYGGFFESSDETLKDFHSDIPIDLDALAKLPKKYFTWKSDSTNPQIGTSAQELQKIYPELVSADSDGILHVAYDKLSIIALAAIDKLCDRLEDMRTENEELKVRLERLERLVYEN